MNANELRIGSYLKVQDTIIKVGKISENHISWNLNKDITKVKVWNPFISLNDERIKPIELSDDIFLVCGFEKANGLWTKEGFNISFTKFTNEPGLYIVFNKGLLSIGIQYLHQLQNLYFVITNQELEIQL